MDSPVSPETATSVSAEPSTTAPPPTPAPARASRVRWVALAILAAGGLALWASGGLSRLTTYAATADDKKGEKKEDPKEDPPAERKIAAPELEGGVAWLNTAGPISLKKDLKGKVVILDFWTLCCINCIHIMPDLAKLEKKYPNELVVIGVHSPKFDNERDTRSIRKAILRYQIEHPVVNDADRKIWDRYEIDAWPTLIVIDPEGNVVGYTSGEGNYEVLDIVVGKLIKEHRAKKTLNETPIRFDLAKYREKGDTPLFFPGKVLADEAGKRLVIADSTHHRIVVSDLQGNVTAVAGTGVPGLEDGPFDKARFDDPQGMAIRGDTLYVADRKNHVVRALDLQAKTVKTIAGNGEQDMEPIHRRLDRPIGAKTIGLNSPWDLLLIGDTLYVAMAGHHQIWAIDLKKEEMQPFSGSGRENIGDGHPRIAMFAQPSGLATDGKFLYVADSEVSGLRKVSLADGRAETLVGRGLFVFGDQDGPGRVEDPLLRETTEARLQHALGVAHHDGKLYLADTYNSKIRVFDLKSGKLETLLGGDEREGWFAGPMFNEPAGISFMGGKLYVADTNAHRIRVVDLATRQVTTMKFKGLEPPTPPKK